MLSVSSVIAVLHFFRHQHFEQMNMMIKMWIKMLTFEVSTTDMMRYLCAEVR